MADDKVPILDACRQAVRLPPDFTDDDGELSDLIGAARAELRRAGVSDAKTEDDADGSIRLAIKTYVRANYGLDNPDAERLMKSFDAQVCSMAGNGEYGGGR